MIHPPAAAAPRAGRSPRLRARAAALALAMLLPLAPQPVMALDTVAFSAPGAADDLSATLRQASLLLQAEAQGTTTALDLIVAARSDYARLLGVLYAAGHYSGVIRITLDGREAAAIDPIAPPARIDRVAITVEPGPVFAFGRAEVAPLAPGTELPEGFRSGSPAFSGLVGEAARAGVSGWRATGHAKADIAEEGIIADHRARILHAAIGLAPGPRLRFGSLAVAGEDRMREAAIRRLFALPEGEVFDPTALERGTERLRRTGIFSTLIVTESDRPNPDGTLDIGLEVSEGPPRRLSFGALLNSREGLTTTASWLHRNLRGGGERLLLEGAIEGIGGETGADFRLAARLDRPATVGPDTTGYITAELARNAEEDYTSDSVTLGFGFARRFSETLTADLGLTAYASRVEEFGGVTNFRRLSLPLRVTWDSRDSTLDATEGFYVDATAAPFLGFGDTGSGIRLTADARAYRELGRGGTVLAGRLQLGSVFGPTLLATPRDDLFYSGGGGTVRGQPFQALGVNVLRGGSVKTGGQHFLGLSGEVRVPVRGNWGAVAFYDAGFVAPTDFLGDTGEWHSGAGVGLRYDTGIGPIRVDLAVPVGGDTGDGFQIYVGIGQAF